MTFLATAKKSWKNRIDRNELNWIEFNVCYSWAQVGHIFHSLNSNLWFEKKEKQNTWCIFNFARQHLIGFPSFSLNWNRKMFVSRAENYFSLNVHHFSAQSIANGINTSHRRCEPYYCRWNNRNIVFNLSIFFSQIRWIESLFVHIRQSL